MHTESSVKMGLRDFNSGPRDAQPQLSSRMYFVKAISNSILLVACANPLNQLVSFQLFKGRGYVASLPSSPNTNQTSKFRMLFKCQQYKRHKRHKNQ